MKLGQLINIVIETHFYDNPADIYLLKVKSRNIRKGVKYVQN